LVFPYTLNPQNRMLLQGAVRLPGFGRRAVSYTECVAALESCLNLATWEAVPPSSTDRTLLAPVVGSQLVHSALCTLLQLRSSCLPFKMAPQGACFGRRPPQDYRVLGFNRAT
jgi:hypothetical protein